MDYRLLYRHMYRTHEGTSKRLYAVQDIGSIVNLCGFCIISVMFRNQARESVRHFDILRPGKARNAS